MTDESLIHRQLMRMHGFSLMSMVLTENIDDKDIARLASTAFKGLKFPLTWKGIGRDGQVEATDTK